MTYTEMFQIETIWWIKVSEQQDLQEPTEMNEPLSKAWDGNEDDINLSGSISNAGFHKPSQTMRSFYSLICMLECWSGAAASATRQRFLDGRHAREEEALAKGKWEDMEEEKEQPREWKGKFRLDNWNYGKNCKIKHTEKTKHSAWEQVVSSFRWNGFI